MESLGEIDSQFVAGTREHAAVSTEGRHPGVVTALAWLTYSHLPEELRTYSAPFYHVAIDLIGSIRVDSAELTTALNRLVEAKDWAVRASIRAHSGQPGPHPRPQTVVDRPEFRGPVDNRIGPNFGRPIQDRPQA
jgi:hypothetical protein